MGVNPPVPPGPQTAGPGGLPPAKKSHVLMWILIIVGGFCVVMIAGVLTVGLFIAHKAKQAGLDPDLLKKNPALAAARMLVAANPDLDFVSADNDRQEITVREKKTGKVYSMSFDDVKKGKLTFKEDGKTVTIAESGGGANGKLDIKSSDGGSLQIGGDAKIPAWVPDYPGSNPQGAFSAQDKNSQSGTFTYKTKDSVDKVVKYYQDQFQSSGLKVNSNLTTQNGQSSGGMVNAQDAANKHNVMLLIGTDSEGTSVTVTYSTNQ